jgi:hypothetical protein
MSADEPYWVPASTLYLFRSHSYLGSNNLLEYDTMRCI